MICELSSAVIKWLWSGWRWGCHRVGRGMWTKAESVILRIFFVTCVEWNLFLKALSLRAVCVIKIETLSRKTRKHWNLKIKKLHFWQTLWTKSSMQWYREDKLLTQPMRLYWHAQLNQLTECSCLIPIITCSQEVLFAVQREGVKEKNKKGTGATWVKCWIVRERARGAQSLVPAQSMNSRTSTYNTE